MAHCAAYPDGYMIEATEPAMVWQPIETAPKNGLPVLVCVGGHYDIAVWRRSPLDGDLWHLRREGFSSDRWSPSPTHWLPLPALPAAQAK